jgi:hypothetical protein
MAKPVDEFKKMLKETEQLIDASKDLKDVDKLARAAKEAD